MFLPKNKIAIITKNSFSLQNKNFYQKAGFYSFLLKSLTWNSTFEPLKAYNLDNKGLYILYGMTTKRLFPLQSEIDPFCG